MAPTAEVQVVDLRLYSSYSGGPFPDERAFNEFLISGIFPLTPAILKKKFEEQLRADHRIVFTYADLTQHNIIVRDNHIVGLIDWQYAGWFPEYWDYGTMSSSSLGRHEIGIGTNTLISFSHRAMTRSFSTSNFCYDIKNPKDTSHMHSFGEDIA